MQDRYSLKSSGFRRLVHAITGRRRPRQGTRPAIIVPGLLALAAILGLLVTPAWAATATFTINSINDDATGNAANCPANSTATGTGSCTLRDALTAANAAGGGGISFDATVFGSAQTITLINTLPAITASNVTITGPTSGSGATLKNLVAVSGAGSYGIFYVAYGAWVVISNLNLVDAGTGAYGGSAILNAGTLTVTGTTFSGNSNVAGGAIFNDGTLTISNSTFSENSTTSYGGAIDNQATLTITNSTFFGNSATSTAFGWGGAIFESTGTLTVTNSTFAENSAAAGGAINQHCTPTCTGTVTVINSIFSTNSAQADQGGGIYNEGGTVSEKNNVFYSDAGGDAAGFELSSTDVTGKDPKLAPLGWYGGATETMALLPGSAAICAGDAIYLPAGTFTDQRGYNLDIACPSGGDAGAVQTNQYVVTTLNDADDGSCTSIVCSLRDALTADNTTAGDVTFAPSLAGTITLTSALPAITDQFNLLGPGAQTITVSGNNSAAVGTVVTMSPGVGAFVYGVTIANGNTYGSTTNNGGALWSNGTLSIANSAFMNNSALSASGGAVVANGALTVVNCTFSGNSAGIYGAGAIVSNNIGTVTNSTFSGNSATGNSTASTNGGAIVNSGSLTIADSTFFGNTVTNSPGGSGGAIYSAGTLTITNSTFATNSVTGTGSEGGAIYNWAGTLTTANNIFSGNSATSGGGIYLNGGSLEEQSNLYYNNAGGDIDNASGSIALGAGDLTGNPNLSALGSYGGPTQTMIPLSGSEALGNGSYQSGEPTTDQRGAPRPSTTNAAIDIGAVQITLNPPIIVAVTPNTGPTSGGTSVAITGAGLDAATSVSFGLTPAASFTVTAASGTTPAYVTAVSPTDIAATVDVTVTNSSGISATSPSDEFTYLAPAATPAITPGTGTYTSNQSVTISDSTSGAAIYYTTDGSIPTATSTQYTGTIAVSSDETINAIAAGGGYGNSAVASATYTFTPGFTAGPGGTTSLTLSAGATTGNTATIVVEGTYGFTGTVSLTCGGTTNLTTVHDKPTCSLNPASVTLSATTTTANATLTITTTAPTSSQNQMRNLFWPSAGGTALALLFFFVPWRRKNWPALLGLLAIAIGVGFIGCGGGKNNGGGGGGGGTNSAGTTTGSYTVIVTGTSGSTTATVGTIALTVQ